MNADTLLPNRIRASSPGLGQGSQVEIELRAAELALSDGRERVTDADLALAAAELAGAGTTIEVTDVGAALLSTTTTDRSTLQTGHLEVTSSAEENDNSIAEQLIGSGLEEADHDIRVAAEMERKKEEKA